MLQVAAILLPVLLDLFNMSTSEWVANGPFHNDVKPLKRQFTMQVMIHEIWLALQRFASRIFVKNVPCCIALMKCLSAFNVIMTGQLTICDMTLGQLTIFDQLICLKTYHISIFMYKILNNRQDGGHWRTIALQFNSIQFNSI